jgi:hypothetical protein
MHAYQFQTGSKNDIRHFPSPSCPRRAPLLLAACALALPAMPVLAFAAGLDFRRQHPGSGKLQKQAREWAASMAWR